MRVLYLNRGDAFKDTSSLVIIAKSVIRYMLESDPEMYVTWVVPRGTKDDDLLKFVLLPLGENARRVRFEKVAAGLSGRTLGYFFNEDIWYALTQSKVQVPYDVVISNQMALTPMYSFLLANRYQSMRHHVDTPIVNWQMWTATTQQLKEVPEYYAGEADVVAESMSSMFGTNVWESEVLLQAHLETMRQYVQPHVVRKVLAESKVIANGVDWPNLSKVYEARKERMEAGAAGRMFWGGRLANQKKPRVTFPLMEKASLLAGAPEPIVSTNRPEGDPDVQWVRETFPGWELHAGMNRDRFFEVMQYGDVFMCDSPSESYGVAWLEMLAAGMLGVFAPAWWNKTLLPDWYPFVSEDAGERTKMAAALLKQYPDGPLWKTYVPQIRDWIRDEHNEQACGTRIGELLREKKAASLAKDGGKGRSTIGQLADKALWSLWDGSTPVPEEDVFKVMSTLSDTNREWGKHGDLVTPMFIRRALETSGWRDICQSAVVEYVRS
jgi:hypothetical protein